jgi:hypothetical protein
LLFLSLQAAVFCTKLGSRACQRLPKDPWSGPAFHQTLAVQETYRGQ